MGIVSLSKPFRRALAGSTSGVKHGIDDRNQRKTLAYRTSTPPDREKPKFPPIHLRVFDGTQYPREEMNNSWVLSITNSVPGRKNNKPQRVPPGGDILFEDCGIGALPFAQWECSVGADHEQATT